MKEHEKQVLQDKNKVLQCEKQVLEGDKRVLEGQKQVLQGEKQVLQDRNKLLQCENTDLYKCKADMTKDPLKDLNLKALLLNGGENKFAVIRGQMTHATPRNI